MSDADGIILSLPELLVLLDAVGADELIGVDEDSLVPDSPEEHADLVLQGIERLKKRSLLEVVDDVHVINQELMMIGQIFAHPQLAIVIRKEVPERGEQLFLYYQREQFIIEHTMPDSDKFRFATIPNTLALINRIEFILPVREEPSADENEHTLEQEYYLGSQWLAQRGQVEEAATVLGEHGLPHESAESLARVLKSHSFAGAIGLLRVENGTTIDARELAVLQSDDAAWLVQHEQPGGDTLVIRSTDAEEFRVQLFELLRNLVQQG